MPRAGEVRRRVRLRRSGRPTGVVLRRLRSVGDPRPGHAARAHPRAPGGHRPQPRRAQCDGRRQLGPGGQGGPSDGEGAGPGARWSRSRPGSDEPRETTLLEGHDFFGSPRVDPAGQRLAVVVWDHPDMPWDASTLLVLPLDRAEGDGMLQAAGPPWPVAGGPGESVGQPAWCRDGTLRFVSDRRGWWQPYVHPGVPEAGSTLRGADRRRRRVPRPGLGARAVHHGGARRRHAGGARDGVRPRLPGAPRARRPGRSAGPAVRLDRRALCPRWGAGTDRQHTRGAGERLGVGAGTGRPRPASVAGPALARGDVARGEPFTLAGRSGRPVHGTLYRPASAATTAPEGRPPPLVTWCHGGPTSSCQAGLDLTVQFFTTRGFAVACVDYAGSSGYGRSVPVCALGAMGCRRRRGLPRCGVAPRGAG